MVEVCAALSAFVPDHSSSRIVKSISFVTAVSLLWQNPMTYGRQVCDTYGNLVNPPNQWRLETAMSALKHTV